MTRCVSATSRLRSHNRIDMSMASPGLGHISPISHSFRLVCNLPSPSPSQFLERIYSLNWQKCARKTCLLDRWQIFWLSKMNEANARGKIMWNGPEERAKVQVRSFKMQSSLARRCGRSARDPRSRNRNWPFGNSGNFLGGWWAPALSRTMSSRILLNLRPGLYLQQRRTVVFIGSRQYSDNRGSMPTPTVSHYPK